MTKTFIFISGLPASGKDTAAEFFSKNQYHPISYSSAILLPLAEKPKTISNLINETMPKTKKETIEKVIKDIEKIKETQKGRELLITLGVKILPEFIKKNSNNFYSHFNLLAKPIFDKYEKIVIASFRMEEEIKTIKRIYPTSKIIKILIHTPDKIRHKRIKERDNLDFKTIIENEKYEKETTYLKLLKKINFNYVIENNKDLAHLEKKLNKLLKIINNNKNK